MNHPDDCSASTGTGDAQAAQINELTSTRLQQWAHAQLRQLPDVPAPHTLPARVWQAVALRQRQWWQQPLLHWPLWARCMTLLLAIGCIGGVQAGWLGVGAGLRDGAQSLVQMMVKCWQLVEVLKHTLYQLLMHAPQLMLLPIGLVMACLALLVTGVAGLSKLTAR